MATQLEKQFGIYRGQYETVSPDLRTEKWEKETSTQLDSLGTLFRDIDALLVKPGPDTDAKLDAQIKLLDAQQSSLSAVLVQAEKSDSQVVQATAIVSQQGALTKASTQKGADAALLQNLTGLIIQAKLSAPEEEGSFDAKKALAAALEKAGTFVPPPLNEQEAALAAIAEEFYDLSGVDAAENDE